MSFLDDLFTQLPQLPATLGQKAATASLSVVLANDQPTQNVQIVGVPPAGSTATVTTVPASANVVTLQAANANRVGLIIANNKTSTSTLCVRFASGASLSNWSVQIEPGGTYEMPPRYYSGIVTGIWSNAAGDAHVTET